MSHRHGLKSYKICLIDHDDLIKSIWKWMSILAFPIDKNINKYKNLKTNKAMIKNEILNVQLPISSLDSAVRCFKLSHGKFLAQFFRCAVSVLVSLLFAGQNNQNRVKGTYLWL